MSKRNRQRHSAQPPGAGLNRKTHGPEEALRARLLEFSRQPRFKKEIERALDFYFGKAARRRGIEEGELAGFMEWVLYDFAPEEGARLVDQFAAEFGPTLPPDEAQKLTVWRAMNRLRLFEIQAVQPGVSVRVRDLLNEEELTVFDYTASNNFHRWEIIMARPHLAEDRLCFTGSSLMLPPLHKAQLLAAAQKLWQTYQTQKPEAAVLDFYRERSLELMREFKRVQDEASRPPIPLTAEGHTIVDARAEYTLRDPNAVADVLEATEEFPCAGEDEERPDALHFNWILCGRSRQPAAPAFVPPNAVNLKTQVTRGAGEPTYLSLGDVVVWRTGMELACLSQERLEIGKALLAEILGDLIRHRRDRLRPLKMDLTPAERPPARTRPPRHLDPEELELEQQQRGERTTEWLQTPSRALNNLSPLQAQATPEGRAELIEIMKSMEYLDEQRQENGGPPIMDLPRIRRELGLPPD